MNAPRTFVVGGWTPGGHAGGHGGDDLERVKERSGRRKGAHEFHACVDSDAGDGGV
jgi:hypothetical protein